MPRTARYIAMSERSGSGPLVYLIPGAECECVSGPARRLGQLATHVARGALCPSGSILIECDERTLGPRMEDTWLEMDPAAAGEH